MYEDLNEIATLMFNKQLESISGQTRERVRQMQNEYATQTNSSGVRSGPQEAAIGRAQIEGSERLVRALFEIWVDLVKRRNGHISRSDVDFIAKKLEGFAQTQKGHLHSAISSQRMGAVVNLLTEEAERRLYASTANARRDLAIMAREHELFSASTNAGKQKAESGSRLYEDSQQQQSAQELKAVDRQSELDSNTHSNHSAFHTPNKKTIWAEMWSSTVAWIVSGALGGWIGFMTSGHRWLADGSFIAGTVLLLIRFWTWQRTKDHAQTKRRWLRVGATIVALFTILAALSLNHSINRVARSAAAEGQEKATLQVDSKGSMPEQKTGGQAPPNDNANSSHTSSPTIGKGAPKPSHAPQAQLQEFTLVLRNEVATPQFYVNDRKSLPISYSSGIARLQLATGSYLVRAEYPNLTCQAFVTLPLEEQRPIPADCKLK